MESTTCICKQTFCIYFLGLSRAERGVEVPMEPDEGVFLIRREVETDKGWGQVGSCPGNADPA